MDSKDKILTKKSGKSAFSIVLIAAASVVALIGIVLLVNNIVLFNKTVSQYVAQGYPADMVRSELLPTQLLPGLFESIGVYGGIAFVLFGIAVVNKKVSKLFAMLGNTEACNEIVEESVMEQNAAEAENAEVPENLEITENTETVEEAEKAE